MNAEYTGKKIAELRKEKNFTQKQLADRYWCGLFAAIILSSDETTICKSVANDTGYSMDVLGDFTKSSIFFVDE